MSMAEQQWKFVDFCAVYSHIQKEIAITKDKIVGSDTFLISRKELKKLSFLRSQAGKKVDRLG